MTHIPRLFCGDCDMEMLASKTGIELRVDAKIGPYYKIQGDEYACPACGHRTIRMGLNTQPYAEHYEPGFDRVRYDKVVRLAETLEGRPA